jgi:hypothetical protein
MDLPKHWMDACLNIMIVYVMLAEHTSSFIFDIGCVVNESVLVVDDPQANADVKGRNAIMQCAFDGRSKGTSVGGSKTLSVQLVGIANERSMGITNPATLTRVLNIYWAAPAATGLEWSALLAAVDTDAKMCFPYILRLVDQSDLGAASKVLHDQLVTLLSVQNSRTARGASVLAAAAETLITDIYGAARGAEMRKWLLTEWVKQLQEDLAELQTDANISHFWDALLLLAEHRLGEPWPSKCVSPLVRDGCRWVKAKGW